MPFSPLLNPPVASPGALEVRRVPGLGADLVRDPVSGRLTRLRAESVAPDKERGGAPDAAQPHGGTPLPCLYSNNSIGTFKKLTPYQRKNAYSLHENLAFLVEKFGIEKVGFLTLTFPKNLSHKEANRRFNSLATNVLGKLFLHFVCVREFTAGGRPHFHLVVVCHGDIWTDFAWSNYLAMARLNSRRNLSAELRVERDRLAKSLNPTSLLRSLWGQLRRVLPKYQFGRAELLPIRKTGAALARYVGGYIRKSMNFRPESIKGARLITYSKGFPRRVVGHAWSFNSDGSANQRAKRAVFAKLHRIKDMDRMKLRFGPRWAWWLNDLISSINLVPVLSHAETYQEASAALSRYINGPENEAFCLAMDQGVSMLALHLRCPELPKDSAGVTINPPKRLRAIFDFHLANWSKTADEIASDSDSYRRRMQALRESGRVNFTHEAIALAKELLLFKKPLVSRADPSERAENFRRLVHPVRPDPEPDASGSWEWAPVIQPLPRKS